MAKLIRFCQQSGLCRDGSAVSPSVLDFTEQFIRKSFNPKKGLLSQASYMDSFSGWVADNCFTESENSVLQRDRCGPTPNNGVDVAIDRITCHTANRYQTIMTNAIVAAQETIIYRPNETSTEKLRRVLSKDLVLEAIHHLVAEYVRSTGESAVCWFQGLKEIDSSAYLSFVLASRLHRSRRYWAFVNVRCG